MNQLAPPSTTEADDTRLVSLSVWLASLAPRYGLVQSSLRPASVDASSRRYFRVDSDGGTLIAVDAPPSGEESRPFIRVAALMRAAGVHVPDILVSDLAQGFLLLSDLGDTTYLIALNDGNADELFGDAIDALIRWQLSTVDGILPPYDEALLRRELNLFPDWFVARHLQRELTGAQSATLEQMFARIVAANLSQPTVFVHRDYMPRNLIVSKPNPGVLDFQDAVIGPIAYDVASLFRDAFISWNDDRVRVWARLYFDQARAAGLPLHADFDDFWRDFEWMGVQRHLKVLGIFARIRYRDGKPHYLEDAPRFIGYVRAVTQRYSELAPLARLFDQLELA
jgi:aminoglycoside/choline kinase family phosphotransferase